MTTKQKDVFLDDSVFSIDMDGNKTRRNVDPMNYFHRRTGVGVANWKSKIKEGISATSAFTAERHERLVSQGSMRYTFSNGRETFQTYCGHICSPNPGHYSGSMSEEARSIAAIKVRMKIDAESSSFSGPTFLGELRESIHQMRHPAEAAFNLTVAHVKHCDLLRGKFRKRKITKKEYADAIAGSWLEFSFGLAPLMSDISKIASASLTVFEDKRLVRLTGSGVVSDSVSSRGVGGDGVFSTVSRYRNEVTTYTTKYTVGYQRNVQGATDSLRNVVNAGNFELSELIPTAWELIPWSFFIDYFSNIGKCISADLVSMANVVWHSRVERYQFDVLIHSFCIESNALAYLGTGTFSETPIYATRYTYVNRTDVLPDFPTIQFRLPGRAGQFLNIAALATLVFKKPS